MFERLLAWIGRWLDKHFSKKKRQSLENKIEIEQNSFEATIETKRKKEDADFDKMDQDDKKNTILDYYRRK
jgi:hypothetical protein